MCDKISSIDFNNIDTFALEITKTFLTTIKQSNKSINPNTYTKAFVSCYTIFKQELDNLKSSDISINDLLKETSELLAKD